MFPALSLAVLLLSATSSAIADHQSCTCSSLLPASLRVNCSSLNLMELPHLPTDTSELHVQNNRITSVSPGLFDRLVGLKKASLSGNPFHCDCRIQYLRNWLLQNKAIVSKEPICASPSSVAQKAVSELSDEYFSSCAPTSCTNGTYNILIGMMLCCVIGLLLWCFRLAKTTTFTLYIDERHSGFEIDSLRSLKPKHRRRLHTDYTNFTMDLEKPPLNMELLPQVLDMLHKKHNIKIKAT
ncbi:platelet glycoprotein IX [Halichoeres trimaculatus]|uniref:platelet glycoprotein IX n=1 Tax=Halichoeres trimaculatus TaxID=147232 RepID=UPI003D9EC4B0